MKFLAKHKKLVLSVSLCTILGVVILMISLFFIKNTGNHNLESLDKNAYQYNAEERTLLNNLGFTDKELEYLSEEEINYFTNILYYEEKNLSTEQFSISDYDVKFYSKSIYFVEDNKNKVFIKYRLEFPNGIKEREHDLLNVSTIEHIYKTTLETLGDYTYSSLYCEETIEKDGKVENNDYFIKGNVIEPVDINAIYHNELIEYTLPKDYTNFYFDNGIKKEERSYNNFVLSVGKAFELDFFFNDADSISFVSNIDYIHQKKSFEIDYTKLSYASSMITYDSVLVGNNSKFGYKKNHFHEHCFKTII